jgi:UDP-2,3-diacylglucosamine hydrolase
LGDIFDLWIADSPVFIRKFQAIVDAIREIKDRDISVVYFEGNHELHIKNFWEYQLRIPVYTEHRVFEFGPINLRLEHGDLINRDDKAYKRYRNFIRHPLTETILPWVSGRVLNELGQVASHVSRKFSDAERAIKHEPLRHMIRDHAKRIFQTTPYDLIISGHMHVKDDFEFEVDGHKARSINLGCWYDGAKSLKVEIEDGKMSAEFVELS